VERVEQRVRAMIGAGWLDEVQGLVARGFGGWLTATQAIGYAELARHLAGELSLEDAVQQTVKRTRTLARRQMAWFRRDPRIRWFQVDVEGPLGVLDEMIAYLEGA
jgi:tRNA dimethylallyltransferase